MAGAADWPSLGAALGVGGTQPLGGVVPDCVQLVVGANGAPQVAPKGVKKLAS